MSFRNIFIALLCVLFFVFGFFVGYRDTNMEVHDDPIVVYRESGISGMPKQSNIIFVDGGKA